jgi:colanic acid biosynthesis glycosyl transferase WcaI
MKIAIISINYRPELTGISVYTTGLAETLAREGDQVDVYTAFPYYPHWRKSAMHEWLWYWSEDINGVRVRRHYLYVPRRPNALRRMIHELSFVFSATLGYLFGPRADVTVIVSPSLFLGIPMAILARLKGSASLFHVQDLQPDAAVDLGMLKPGPVTDFFYWIERLTYRLCNRVSTISEGMRRRVTEKGVPADKVALLRNWANDDQVRVLPHETALRREWGLDGKFVVLYSGNMGVKQGLSDLLECAEVLRAEREVAFVIVGDGGEKDALMAQAEERRLDNVQFRPLQTMERLGELLATADVAVIPQKAGVTDIVLPSKLANILASGRPVVAAAAQGTELAHILVDGDCGRVVPQGDPVRMAEALLDLRDDRELRARLGANGRRYMEAHLGRTAVVTQFRNELQALALRRPLAPQATPLR